MPNNDDPKPEEIVLRGLLRLPAELDPATGRPHKDRDDFVRRRVYKQNGPENGLSVFRRCKYSTNEALYSRIGSKKPMGTAECTIGDLTARNIKHIVGGEKNDHLSLRCPDCDMACEPEDYKSCFLSYRSYLTGLSKESLTAVCKALFALAGVMRCSSKNPQAPSLSAMLLTLVMTFRALCLA